MGPPEYMAGSVANAPFDVSHDGSTIAISTGDEVVLHVLGCLEESKRLGARADIRRVAFSPDGKRVVTGEWASGKARVWDVASGKLLHTFEEPYFCHVNYSPDGKWIATNSTRVRIWSAGTWELQSELPTDGRSISGVNIAFSPDGQMIAVSDSNAKINFFDPSDGRKIFELTDPNGHLANRLEFNPNGRQLAVSKFLASCIFGIWRL